MIRDSLRGTDRGVSKVVGVVLLVSIVVLLGAVVGGMITQFSDQLDDPAPQIYFEFEHDDDVADSMEEYGVEPESADPADVDEVLIIEHQGGSTVDASNIYIYMTVREPDGDPINWQGTWAEVERTDRIAKAANKFFLFAWGGATFDGGGVQIVWRNDDSTDTVLAEWEG